MKTCYRALMLILLLLVVPGCGGDRERGMHSPNQRKDLPRAAPAPPEKNK